MSKQFVNKKIVRQSNRQESGWIKLAEDAEKDAGKAKNRAKQLLQAARIFRQNADTGIAFPLEAVTQKAGTDGESIPA